MELFEGILTRRSIRRYTDEKISDELIKKLLVAGMSAPSAGNQQDWHFVVITDREILDEIPKFHPYSQMLKQASVAILVCGNIEVESHRGYWIQDCSAATQNILLAAHGLGLGAVWLGIHPGRDRVEGISDLLNLPSHILPLSLISIGYPAEEKPKSERYDDAKISYNAWK